MSASFELANRRISQAALARQQRWELQQAETEALGTVTVLPAHKPGSRDLAPYTLGAKKTKTKMTAGGKRPDSGSTTSLCKKPVRSDLAYESRGYDSQRAPWRLRIRGSAVLYACRGVQEKLVAQFVERDAEPVLEYRVDPKDYPGLIDRVDEFFGLQIPARVRQRLSASQASPEAWETARQKYCCNDLVATRRFLARPTSMVEREKLRKASKRQRSASRPGKRERAAQSAAIDLRGVDMPQQAAIVAMVQQRKRKTPKPKLK